MKKMKMKMMMMMTNLMIDSMDQFLKLCSHLHPFFFNAVLVPYFSFCLFACVIIVVVVVVGVVVVFVVDVVEECNFYLTSIKTRIHSLLIIQYIVIFLYNVSCKIAPTPTTFFVSYLVDVYWSMCIG